MTIQPRSLHPTLGPLPCLSCGRLVVWGVAVHEVSERPHVGYVRRRDLYDKSTEQPHECRATRAVAA